MFNATRDQLVDLDRRTTPVESGIAAQASTTSTLYTDLDSSPGPAAVCTVGANGIIGVSWSAGLATNTAAVGSWMSVAFSGAYTLGAADLYSLFFTSPTAFAAFSAGMSLVFGGLNPGSITTTAKYRINSAGTMYAINRFVTVHPLGA